MHGRCWPQRPLHNPSIIIYSQLLQADAGTREYSPAGWAGAAVSAGCPTELMGLWACAGPLRAYVTSEVNVVEMDTCSDPARYCNIRAQPEWQVQLLVPHVPSGHPTLKHGPRPCQSASQSVHTVVSCPAHDRAIACLAYCRTSTGRFVRPRGDFSTNIGTHSCLVANLP